jgi:hypothetical protein
MLLANSAGASVVTLQFVLILEIDGIEIDGFKSKAAGQDAPAVIPAVIQVAQTWLPTQFQMPQLYNPGNPAGAPILTLAPAPASLDISPGRSQAVSCAECEAVKEAPIAI